MEKLLPRFLEFVAMDTQSDPESESCPSTDKQWALAKVLVKELEEIGMEQVSLDGNGYIMASLPSNLELEAPTIGFIAHYDTSPDYSGTNVRPKVIANYDGGTIVLNKEKGINLSPDYFEDLLQYKGQTIITTDGTTLLGADDKAGVAEIITAMEHLVRNPQIKHGKIRVAFTPDEEIGRGAHRFDVNKFGADWAYTMDGSQVGELEFENFNAAAATIDIRGKSVHPGYAKGKMVNALLLAHRIMEMLPKNETPETTEGREGFFHVHHMQGSIESAQLKLLIRDHDDDGFNERKELLQTIIHKINQAHDEPYIRLGITDQYQNMRKKVEPAFHIVEIAQEAMELLGITPIIKPIRGGTDGSQLSFMGLPCPNIFAGGHNFHGKYEYVPLESMQKAVEVIVKICELTGHKHAGHGSK